MIMLRYVGMFIRPMGESMGDLHYAGHEEDPHRDCLDILYP